MILQESFKIICYYKPAIYHNLMNHKEFTVT